jgi:hypothetical protein
MSAEHRFLVSVPTAGKGPNLLFSSQMQDVDMRDKQRALMQLIEGDFERISIHTLRRCLRLLQDDAFVNSITEPALRRMVLDMRDFLIRDAAQAIKNRTKLKQRAVKEKQKHMKEETKIIKKDSPEKGFEDYIWCEICKIRDRMISENKRKHPIPSIKNEINMSEKAMQRALLNDDERDDDDEESSDDDEKTVDREHNSKTVKKVLKGFVEMEDVKKHMTSEERKALARQQQDEGRKHWGEMIETDVKRFLKGFVEMEVAKKNMTRKEQKAFELQQKLESRKYYGKTMATDDVARNIRSARKQTNWFTPTFETCNTEAGMAYQTNEHIHIMKTRLSQILTLCSYWKTEIESFRKEIKSIDDNVNAEDSLVETRLRKRRFLTIFTDLHQLQSQVEKEMDLYAEKFKKLQDRELAKKGNVKRVDQEFQKGDPVDLYWVEEDDNGDDKWLLLTDLEKIQEPPEFVEHHRQRIRQDGKSKWMHSYVISMKERDFNSLQLDQTKRDGLVVTDIPKKKQEAAQFIRVSLNADDKNWHLQGHWPVSDVSEDSSEGYVRSQVGAIHSGGSGSDYDSDSSGRDELIDAIEKNMIEKHRSK